jgi:hypothetical protein
VAEIERSRELGARRVEEPKYWVFKVARREDAKWRRGERIRTIHLRRTVAEIERSRELGSSQGEEPKHWVLQVTRREEREGDSHWIQIVGGPLDLHVGSCIGTSQEKVREFGHGDREVARRRYPDSWRIVWAIAEREWNTGGTKPSGSRCEKSRGIGIRSREVPRSRDLCGRVAEHKVGPRGRRVDTRCLEIGVNTPLNSRNSGTRGIGR